jgi:hypothetical protein
MEKGDGERPGRRKAVSVVSFERVDHSSAAAVTRVFLFSRRRRRDFCRSTTRIPVGDGKLFKDALVGFFKGVLKELFSELSLAAAWEGGGEYLSKALAQRSRRREGSSRFCVCVRRSLDTGYLPRNTKVGRRVCLGHDPVCTCMNDPTYAPRPTQTDRHHQHPVQAGVRSIYSLFCLHAVVAAACTSGDKRKRISTGARKGRSKTCWRLQDLHPRILPPVPRITSAAAAMTAWAHHHYRLPRGRPALHRKKRVVM